nr:AlpA family phage regulatory protein [Parerythrobacter lutipelagi]
MFIKIVSLGGSAVAWRTSEVAKWMEDLEGWSANE